MEGRPMVSYLTGVMNSLVDRLTKLEVHHPKLKYLREDLENHKKDHLDKFAGRGAKANQVKVWIKQVRELVYDIDDWIELEPLTNLGESEIKQIEEQIEVFKAQIQEARERCTRYDLPKKVPTSDADLSDVGRSKVTIDSRLLWEEKTVLIAVDVAKNELEKHLMNEEKQLKVVCVVGMDGYGKTSIAKEIYGKLGRQFDCQAFVSVGRRPAMKSTLLDILRQVNPQDEREYGDDVRKYWDVQQVIAELWKFLGTKRYFILIDDLRSTWAWKVINSALPDKNLGSRVLTTTCIMDVAKSCSIHPSDVIYRVEALSDNNSRSLFRSRISIREEEEEERPAGFKEVSDDMLKMCGGMPLAIIVAAGLLTRKSAELGPSKRLEKYTLSASDQYSTSQGMRNILDMSYADLSLPVKSCFLYVSVFPENYTIKKDRLIRVWVAEGFIPKRDEENSWETGESYFNELISRRLIQPVFDYDDGQAVGCTVHGVILDFIASLSSEENFVTAAAELRSGPFPCDTIRRFSLDCSNQEEDDTLASSTVHISKVRSLTCFGDVKLPDETLHSLRFLRVLDLEDTENLENRHLKGIGRLVLLRYLGLGGTGIEVLPEEIGELQNLETLDLRRTTRLRTLPASIVGLRKLVSLLGERVQLPSGIGNMQDLEELSTIVVDSSSSLNSVAEMLNKSKPLSMLGVRWGEYYYHGRHLETTETCRGSVMSFLNEVVKSNLRSLLLQDYPAGDLLDLLLDSWEVPPRHLRRFELTISGRLGGVPHKIASLVSLTHLCISIDEGETEGLRLLGDLPNLVLLHLDSSDAAPGRCTISGDGFRSLMVFLYTCEFGVMGLQFKPGAMPQLRMLRIEFSARETNSLYGYFDFGIQHLSCLQRVHATINCNDARASEVEAAEAAIRERVSQNPSSPVLELSRRFEGRLKEISAKIGGAGADESDRRAAESAFEAAESAFEAAISKHPSTPGVNVQWVEEANRQADSRIYMSSESSSHLPIPGMEHAAATAFSKIVMSRLVLEIDKRYKMMKDLKLDTESIIYELDTLSHYMDDQLKRRDAHRTAVAREYSKMMRDWTHDMEDCIERFLHRVTCKEGASRIRQAAHGVKTFRSRYRFATRIKKLKKRLEEARDRIKKLPGSDQFSASPAELNPPRRGSDPAGRKSAVGMEKPMGDLLALLEDQQQQLRVISIVGFGGSGKTTLARAAYDDTDVVGKFPCRAWVDVRSLERSDATGILRYIHQKLLPDQRYSETSLTEYLQDKRYLVVIDGIGDIEGEQWGTITSILGNNGRGSRIIVTTTFRSAANRCSSGSGYVYKMRSLGNEYCMEIALGKRRTQELVEGSTTLLKKCDGLPLALVSVANQLNGEDEPTGQFCANLCSRLGSYLEREVDDDEPNFARLRGVLADNYTGLSNHTVRSCLLYLCIFPNDRPLRRNVVIRRWLAEGYARSDLPYISNLEVANANFDTFINWNIIQPVATSYNEVTKACKTQGIMHEFLLQKSISEKFIVSSRGPSLKKVRHLSVHDRDATSCTTTLDMDLSRVRSLTVSGSAGDAISGFGKYKLMRVLDLEECSDVNDGHLKDICKLWNLRYLSLGARITMLPKEIAKLKLLETLHLSKTTVNVLPVEVIGLPCLIHLIGKFKLPDQEPVSSELEQLSKGSNLETLAGYVASDQSQVLFPQLMVHMKKLRKVKIRCEFTGGSGSNSTDHLSRAIREYMMAHKDYGDVRSLSIDFQKCSEQLQNFLHSLEAPCYLSSLKLHGKLPTLPPFVAYAKDLIQLCLSSTTLTQDVLSAVSNLKNLLYLKLIADHLENFVMRAGAFQSLRRLRFVVRGPNPTLPKIQEGAMPKLVSLQLICEHLAGLSGIKIRDLTSLKEVTLDSRVTTKTRGVWEAAARNHPKRPNVLLFEMVDDPTGNEPTENPVAAPEEAAPDQTAMQGQIAEEGSEPPAVQMNSAAQSIGLFQRNQQLQLASQGN